MTRHLLIGAMAAFTVVAANAETKVYQSDELGEVSGISANGKYATIVDEDNQIAYLWTLETGKIVNISAESGDPAAPSSQRATGTAAYAVDNNGTVVGNITYADGVQRPAFYKDGKWTLLPMSEFAMNTNSAIGISYTGRYIGGYQFYADKASEINGRYRPCLWTLQDDGTYKLNSYDKLDMLDHQGFFPRCMSYDGTVMGGTFYLGIDATMAAYIDFQTGEMHYDHKVTFKQEPWMYKGKWYCGDDPETEKQIWTDDPNDPRIVLFTETYIEGIKNDETHTFKGYLSGVDDRNCFYGARSVASDVDEETGTGTITDYAAMLNTKDGVWTDNTVKGFSVYADGLNKGEYIFGQGDELIVKGEATTSTAKFGFSVKRTLAGLYKASADGRILGGSTSEINPASGEPQYYPLVVVLDEALVEAAPVFEPEPAPEPEPGLGVDMNVADGGKAVVNVANGVIDVQGAARVTVFDMQGRVISRSANTSVAAGIYIVEADGKVCKVLVK